MECKEKPRGAYTSNGALKSGWGLPDAIQRFVNDVMFTDNEKAAYPGVEDFYGNLRACLTNLLPGSSNLIGKCGWLAITSFPQLFQIFLRRLTDVS